MLPPEILASLLCKYVLGGGGDGINIIFNSFPDDPNVHPGLRTKALGQR